MTGGAPYLKAPDEITARSFELIDAATDLTGVAADLHGVARRVVHATGDPDAVAALRASDGAAAAAAAALARGAPVLADAEMVARGITRRMLPAANAVICTLGLGTVTGGAARAGATRSATAVELWRPWLGGAVVAIGNAPTALFRLLEGLADGWPKPAAILGFPVGFVGAAEAKDLLAGGEHGVAFITLTGRAGGSAVAAAVVNALGTQARP